MDNNTHDMGDAKQGGHTHIKQPSHMAGLTADRDSKIERVDVMISYVITRRGDTP